MTIKPIDNEDIQKQLQEFLHGIDALMLATVNAEGYPEASYTPFIAYNGCYYILISELASHTRNLKQSAVASVIFIDHKADSHAHTRQRLSCHCDAKLIERSHTDYEAVMQLMQRQFGKLIETLRGLNDFQLFQLKPVKGNFVVGFGQAFAVDFAAAGKVRHRNPD